MADRADLTIVLTEDDTPRAGAGQGTGGAPQAGAPTQSQPPYQQQRGQQQPERQDPLERIGWPDRVEEWMSRSAPAWREDPFDSSGSGGMRGREDPFERLAGLMRDRQSESVDRLGDRGADDPKIPLMEKDVELREEDLRLRRLEKARRDNTYGGGVNNWINETLKMVGSPMTALGHSSTGGLVGSAGMLGNKMQGWGANAAGIFKRFRQGVGRKASGIRKGGMLAGAGGALKAGLRMAGPAGMVISTFASAAQMFSKAVNAFIQRGLELSAYSGDLAGAAARKQIRELMTDINEAQVTGRNVARLMDSWGRLTAAWKRNVETPVKNFAAGVLADVVEQGPPAAMTGGLRMIAGAFGVSQKQFDDAIKKSADMAASMEPRIQGAQQGADLLLRTVESNDALLEHVKRTNAILMQWWDADKERFDRERMREDVAANEQLGGFLLPARILADLPGMQPPQANRDLIEGGPQHVRFE